MNDEPSDLLIGRKFALAFDVDEKAVAGYEGFNRAKEYLEKAFKNRFKNEVHEWCQDCSYRQTTEQVDRDPLRDRSTIRIIAECTVKGTACTKMVAVVPPMLLDPDITKAMDYMAHMQEIERLKPERKSTEAEVEAEIKSLIEPTLTNGYGEW